ncbi:RhoGAP domain containing protein [Tritrichomonas foetus]|uniref:RhoGAP domain containing protein n=1 Tax=Tritrichomonas foetus TaxID=1144522 RepID=A0A1J4KVJ2_9EUKA|nr:RhoGAP domain containing protein [Tritrichomonas foetus]|eukprot:OHT13756.1 RhoGAP domain containing protein [Tritrichomonas foetus]
MSRTIFKVPIELIPRNEDGIPQFLPIVCTFIKQNASMEGIFRKSGSPSMVLEVNERLAQHFPSLPERATVYDVATFLKQWLLYLPNAIIDPSIINQYTQNNNPSSVEKVINHIPYLNRLCLIYLFDMLKSIVDLSSINLMTLDNMMTCFCFSLTQKMKNLEKPFYFRHFYQIINTQYAPLEIYGLIAMDDSSSDTDPDVTNFHRPHPNIEISNRRMALAIQT